MSQEDKGTDTEEQKTEQRGIEIGGAADLPASELHLDLEAAPTGPYHVGHRLTDGVTVQQLLCVGLCIEDRPVDADDDVGGPDPGTIRS